MHTEETKREISLAKTGKHIAYNTDVNGAKNPFYGRHHSTETKAKLSLANKGNTFCLGRIMSPQTRALIGAKAKERYAIGLQHPGNGPTEIGRLKISQKAKERFTNPKHHPFFGRRLTEEHKAKISRLRWKHSEESKRKIAKASRLNWQNKDYARRVFSCLRPNRKELQLGELFRELSLPYKYVGDGQLILGGKCPDFLNVNGQKKLIELYGNFWHQGENPQDRIDYFAQYGFDTLVIWEAELKQPEELKSRLIKFNSR